MRNSGNTQHGGSAAEFLVVAVVATVGAALAIFAFPSLLSSGRTGEAPTAAVVKSEANEAAAIAGLRAIASAEATYAVGQGGGSYATLEDLLAPGLVDSRWKGAATMSGYRFELKVDPAGGTAYCATATPLETGASAYAVSSRGAIYKQSGGSTPQCDPATGTISSGTILGG